MKMMTCHCPLLHEKWVMQGCIAVFSLLHSKVHVLLLHRDQSRDCLAYE